MAYWMGLVTYTVFNTSIIRERRTVRVSLVVP